LPILEIDGVMVAESRTISRLIARRVGLAGKNDIEDALIDSIVDVVADFYKGNA